MSTADLRAALGPNHDWAICWDIEHWKQRYAALSGDRPSPALQLDPLAPGEPPAIADPAVLAVPVAEDHPAAGAGVALAGVDAGAEVLSGPAVSRHLNTSYSSVSGRYSAGDRPSPDVQSADMDREVGNAPWVGDRPSPEADRDSPQWEACKVCGGDHWTKDHPATAPAEGLDEERARIMKRIGRLFDSYEHESTEAERGLMDAIREAVEDIVTDRYARLAPDSAHRMRGGLDLRCVIDGEPWPCSTAKASALDSAQEAE
jgi:hypothetical protein